MSSNFIISPSFSVQALLPAIGSSFEGGYFAGAIKEGEKVYGLIVAPRATGQNKTQPLKPNGGADSNGHLTYLLSNGFTIRQNLIALGVINTYPLMAWAANLRIGGFDDWYIPARDELEIVLRNLKPTAQAPQVGVRETSYEGAGRQGTNISAYLSGHPYTATDPQQTTVEIFQQGGSEALSDITKLLSSSEQRATISAGSNYNWAQSTSGLTQGGSGGKNVTGGRAIRRVLLENI